MSLQQAQAYQLKAKLNILPTDEEEKVREFDISGSDEESSEYEMSDIDSDNCRAARGGNVLSMGDLGSNKRNNESMHNSE